MYQDYSKNFTYINIFNIYVNHWWKYYFHLLNFIGEEIDAKQNEETYLSQMTQPNAMPT